MSNKTFLKVVCVTETAGEPDELPTFNLQTLDVLHQNEDIAVYTPNNFNGLS